MRGIAASVSARTKTFALTGLLAAAGIGLAVQSLPSGPAGGLSGHQLGLVVLLAAVFYLAEQYFVTVEFRRESHSMTVAGVPLALGVMLLPVYAIVLARVVGSLIAFVRQRPSVDKAAYNLAGYACETALAAFAVHRLQGAHVGVTPAAAGVVLAVLLVADQFASACVLLVIRWHSGRMGRADVLPVLTSSATLSTIATATGVTAAVLLQHGWLGAVLVALLVGISILGYRNHAATTRRHAALATVHDFVVNSVGAESLADLAQRAVVRVRQMMRCATAELIVRPLEDPAGDDDVYARIVVDESDVIGPRERRRYDTDWVLTQALDHGVATLVSRATRNPAKLSWLAAAGNADAVVAPLRAGDELLGALVVRDRLGETLTFTPDDLTLLQTLGGHLGMALRSRHVVDRLHFEATHDSLTGLANRAYLGERLKEVAAGDGRDVALLLLDLNKFKEVNDVLGHEIGDQLLVVVAERLVAALPPECVIARLGGDEFAVLVPGTGADLRGHAERLAALARRKLAAPVRFGEALLVPAASVGIATGDTVPVARLLRCADTAMYAAKTNECGIAAYDIEMDRGRAERLALLADLRLALEEHPEQFVAWYQPKFHLASRTVVGAEALVRWHHPERGTINPEEFISLAETSGLIERLTEHMLLQALEECAQWHRAGFDVTVAVNLSPRTVLDADLPQHIDDVLAGLGLPPDRLVLEITESSVMSDPERAVPILRELVERGIVLSLDDFGTGYSSLSYLQQLPVHELKIDRSFVSRLDGDEPTDARTLVRSIIALGLNLGLRVVAEGIETEAQYAELLEQGCHVGQGFLMGRPLSASGIRTVLAREQRSRAVPTDVSAG